MIEEYFVKYAGRLQSDFERARDTHRDSDVNEDIAADFLRIHYPAHYVVTNVEILHSYGESCDEIDVCVCNRDQPFSQAPGQLLIAEGVDFVLQVKATLNGREVERLCKNARRLKALTRRHSRGDELHAKIEDQPHYIDRIPYIVLAYTSQLTSGTAREKVVAALEEVPFQFQPDAIAVLDRGIILNFREGKGKAWSTGGKPMSGWVAADTGNRTLLEMMHFIYTITPRFSRKINPIHHYFASARTYSMSRDAT